MADPIDTDAVRAIICSLSCACHPALSAACDEVDHLRAELILAEKGRREDAAAHMANEAGVDRLRAENTEAFAAIERWRPIVEWAQDAPHHDGCMARHWGLGLSCTCGRDEALAAFGGEQ